MLPVVKLLIMTPCMKNNNIFAAGIDVFPGDETITSAPSSIVRFAELPNVIATSHIAYNTEEAFARLGVELEANINSCLAGKPINVIN